jgi:hypothetical protein
MFVVYRTGAPLDLQLGHHALDNKLYRADAHHWLAAIDIRDGRELRPPVKIEALNLVPNFVPSMQLNRPALLLEAKTKTIYVAFAAAKCDFGGNPYRPEDSQSHGWLFAYDAKNLSQTAFFTTAEGVSSDDSKRIIAGIWQSGNGLASDSQGNVYAFTGNNNVPCGGTDSNGHKQPNCPPIDYSESIIRWNLSTNSAKPVHIRVPEANELDTGGNDGDLAAGGPVLPFDNLLIGGGKQGVLYSISDPADQWPQQWPRPVLGQDNRFDRFQAFYNTWPDHDHDIDPKQPRLDPPPSVCNEATSRIIRHDYAKQANGPNIHGSPVVFQPAGEDFAYIYAMPEKDYLRAFKVSPSGNVDRCPAMTTRGQTKADDLRSPPGMPGGFLSVSANNGRDGIVWASVSCIKKSDGSDCDEATNTSGEVTGRLMAFDALTLKMLWKGDDGPNAVPFAKFVPPTVAAGHVFRVEYKDKIHVYGLKTVGYELEAASCEELWKKRNSIFKDGRYCFETPRAIGFFGNVGCKYHNQKDVPLTGSQRQMVDEITRIEAAKYCR